MGKLFIRIFIETFLGRPEEPYRPLKTVFTLVWVLYTTYVFIAYDWGFDLIDSFFNLFFELGGEGVGVAFRLTWLLLIICLSFILELVLRKNLLKIRKSRQQEEGSINRMYWVRAKSKWLVSKVILMVVVVLIFLFHSYLSFDFLPWLIVLVSYLGVLIFFEQRQYLRFVKGKLGSSHHEARELIQFLLKNQDTLDFTDDEGNSKPLYDPEVDLVTLKEEAKSSIGPAQEDLGYA
ncbi:MAG TPA: hypothetical protein DCR93_22010 [Cytophagales bacterium]|nr:hypothetical protein [Cytophagales bacterium]HAP62056.1 hypothetical protein [Cytophagales bacterium]